MSTHKNRFAKAILTSTHNVCFYGELTKITLRLSSNTILICSSELEKKSSYLLPAVGCVGLIVCQRGPALIGGIPVGAKKLPRAGPGFIVGTKYPAPPDWKTCPICWVWKYIETFIDTVAVILELSTVDKQVW